MSSVITPLELTETVVPFSLRHAPVLIESLFPVQKLSAEAYKEQEGKQGKTLTTLGSYWKGRKPLILNKACILGSLLPATDNPVTDLEIFEMLMGMDQNSLEQRLEARNDKESRFILGQYRSVGHHASYRSWVESACRPDECGPELFDHIWSNVNGHLGTHAHSFAELIAQLGIMRFGHRPRLADAFCGSGQIPFEAARLGCEVFASDLNPVACMLTWGAFNIVGGTNRFQQGLRQAQEDLAAKVQAEIDALAVETDGNGWKPKTFLYCIEVTCPQTGWKVPLLPTRLISKGRAAIAELTPEPNAKRFTITIRSGVSERELVESEKGTLFVDGRGQEPYLSYVLEGTTYRTKISTLRGDYRSVDGINGNRLRQWEKSDFQPRPNDIFQERLYCIQWMRPKKSGKKFEYEFRSVTPEDLKREHIVEKFIGKHLADWQAKGWIPDMRIEPGDKTDEPIRTRGWTHWHHLFTPRQLLLLGLTSKNIRARGDEFVAPLLIFHARLCDWSSKLCRYGTGAARESVAQTFYNQALNTLYAYGVRSFSFAKTYLLEDVVKSPVNAAAEVVAKPATEWDTSADLFITDPPYGDAVKYEEILEFFIAWLRRNPPPEFADWVWDSRRSLAIKGEDEDFRRGMVAAYKRMTGCMSDNGVQVIMFTHQSGSIWADMANIVWASGLQVTAAWYVVTETDSALRDGSYVKGTILLVLRKRQGAKKTTRDDLAWEIQEAVEAQVETLVGLNQDAKGLYRDENVFEDADIQMAGYAAALRVLTRYAIIDGRDMAAEAIRPRIKGETTFVDGLIAFAVGTANQHLVPKGILKDHWDKISGVERFYLKMLDLEASGAKTLDNYQNFAKAFSVRDFKPLLASQKANDARLKSAVEFGRAEMNEGSELHQTVLRAVLYAVMELTKNVDGNEVIAHLMLNIPNYYSDVKQREMAAALSDYLAKHFEGLHAKEADNARVLHELLKNQRLG